jgi:ATP-dependent RNA helicase DeaD
MARVLEPALDRITADADATQLLVITPDTETAVAMAEVSRSLSDRTASPIVAITAAARGVRLLGSRVVPAIAATPATLVALLRSSAVKLDGVRTVIIAWADELFDAREGEALEVVLAELPKDASRIVVADRLSPEVEALVERHLRRASRQGIAGDESSPASLAIRYVNTTPAGRHAAFRRLLDDLDPPSVIVLASDTRAIDEARAAVASLGFEGDASVRVEGTPIEEQAALVVFYDLPVQTEAIAKVQATEPAQVVALVTPRQVAALRRLTTGTVEPLDLSRAAIKARARDERVRSAIRAELQAGFPSREVMALEPLLSEFDGLEIAAAALRLMERARHDESARRVEAERPVQRAAERPTERPTERAAERGDDRREARPRRTESSRGSGEFMRVFLSIGDRDGVRPGDLVGAITGETGITSDRIGKLDIRDGHSIAEIAAADADAVIEKMNGVSLKGRRITARVDDRPAPRSREGGREGRREGGGPRRSGPGDARRGGFRDRGPREGPRGFGGGERGPRGARRDRDEGERRPRRDDDRPRGRGGLRDRDEGRVPRAAREREEWSERGERVRNARRPRRDDT